MLRLWQSPILVVLIDDDSSQKGHKHDFLAIILSADGGCREQTTLYCSLSCLLCLRNDEAFTVSTVIIYHTETID